VLNFLQCVDYFGVETHQIKVFKTQRIEKIIKRIRKKKIKVEEYKDLQSS